jgi:SAM-dependent methyltransferase
LPRICDYEGSQYRAKFWENENRRYEDLAERIALRKMLPPRGERLIEVGAGFGRLVDLYEGYQQVILMDYARSQLEEAQRYLGHDDRFIFVVADVYNMPFVDHLFDTLVMVRVMHHLADVPTAAQEIHRIINPDGRAVIEHANKRHLKSVLRWLLRRQDWNPFSHEPHEFVELNIDFHPTWMRQQFIAAGFYIRTVRTVSHYRLPWLKNHLSAPLLAALDGLMQPTGRWFQYAPSVFLEVAPDKPAVAEVTGFFRCPACGNAKLQQFETILTCSNCHSQWECRENIYDFKTPIK